MAAWFVYIALCADDTIYVGVARDVTARFALHDAGRGARYTRGRGPLRLLASKRCKSHGDSLRVEWALKHLPRADKVALADAPRKLARFARSVLAPGDPTRSSELPSTRARRGA